MNLTRSSLKNPASVIVILVLIILFGILSIFKLPIQLTPDIEQPQITIFSGWRQAAPEEIESVIIEPIENAVKNTPGALEVNTNINRGNGAITLKIDGQHKAIQIPVTVGSGKGELVAISPLADNSLNAGDKIAIRGAERLQTGQEVDVQSK